jgi:hypothetical protein
MAASAPFRKGKCPAVIAANKAATRMLQSRSLPCTTALASIDEELGRKQNANCKVTIKVAKLFRIRAGGKTNDFKWLGD